MGRALGQLRLAHVQGVALDDGQAAGAVIQFAEQGDEAGVLLDQNHLAGVAFQDGAGQAAGAGADLDHSAAVERTGVADDLARHIEVQQEVLAEALLGQQAVGVERFAKGGKVRHRGRLSAWRAPPPSLKPVARRR
ncbi:hypothetical protein D3C81_1772740 [compost metagenome]